MPDQPVKAWADALDAIIQKGVAAKRSGEVNRIAAVQRELRKFKDDSPDFADALDIQATNAIFDLDLTVTEDAVARLKERAAEVYALAKLISGVAEEAKSDAELLSGRLVKDAIDAATSSIAAFKNLSDEMSKGKPDEKAVAAEIDKVLGTIQALRNKLEKH